MKGLLLAVVLVGACGPGTSTPQTWAEVSRGDLVLSVEVTGTLRAVRTTGLTPPLLEELDDDDDFRIVRMAPEGTKVSKGDPALWFNTTQLERRLTDRTSEMESAAKEVERKRADVELAQRDGEMQLAETEAALHKARLRADLPQDITAPVEAKLAKLDLAAAQAEVYGARRRLELVIKLGKAELDYLRGRHDRARSRLESVKQALTKMVVPAPVDGLVIHPVNWRGDKRKIGDPCWMREPCVEVVDTSQMLAKGEVDEMESARVAVGQRVSLRLDALPEREWGASIAEIRPTVYRQSPRNPLKVIGVDLNLDATDQSRMRPGMLFRGRIETGRLKNTLVVPLDAIFVRPQGAIALRRTGTGYEEVPLRLGARNDRQAEVLEGLSEGDQVSRRDLAVAEPAR